MSDLMQERLDRAERALTRAGFTYTEGAQEWRPPIGPSASPLLDRIDQLTGALLEARQHINGGPGIKYGLEFAAMFKRIDAALAGQVLKPAAIRLEFYDAGFLNTHGGGDTKWWCDYIRSELVRAYDFYQSQLDGEWADNEVKLASQEDYRELQAQHDQLQSKYKAALAEARKYKLAGLGMAASVGEHVCVPEGWQLVPFNPSEDQWGGLARAIVFWMRSYPSNQHTPRSLVEFTTSLGHTVPDWMEAEGELRAEDHVMSKGTVAVLIYKAMLAAAPKPEGAA